MKNFLEKGILFIKQNPAIIYSFVLVIVIPVAIFLNTFYIVGHFQKNLDSITQAKAVLIENIIGSVVGNSLEDTAKITTLIDRIIQENDEIKRLEILAPNENNPEEFKIIASSEKEKIGTNGKNTQNILAWNNEEGIAHLNELDGERIWNITKIIRNELGEKKALVSLSFSLKFSDRLIDSTILKSYAILIATVIIVLLLVSNNIKLFGYALAVSKLKEIDEMKDNFISMASHELRSPLTAIKGYLELFNDDKEKKISQESQHYLENISSSIERLNLLVSDILEISRMEGNRIPINLSIVKPQPIIEKSVEEIRSQADRKGWAIEFSKENLPDIKADPERVKQIFVNLLSNAIKYTEKGKIEITAKKESKKLFITFADSGIGISAQEQVHLFQKFYRIKNEKTVKISGTGLGLWITRELARKMKGDISVESIEGVGSHFTVSFPLA